VCASEQLGDPFNIKKYTMCLCICDKVCGEKHALRRLASYLFGERKEKPPKQAFILTFFFKK